MSYNNQPNPNPTSSVGQIISSDGTSRISVNPGTSGQILTAYSSTSSGLGWQNSPSSNPAVILISSTTVTSSATSMTISNIPGSSYSSLKFVGVQPSDTRGGYIYLNGVSTSVYSGAYWNNGQDSVLYTQNETWSDTTIYMPRSGSGNSNSMDRSWELDLFSRETSSNNLAVKGYFESYYIRRDSTSFSGTTLGSVSAVLTASSINSLTFAYSNGASLNGMIITVYGVK